MCDAAVFSPFSLSLSLVPRKSVALVSAPTEDNFGEVGVGDKPPSLLSQKKRYPLAKLNLSPPRMQSMGREEKECTLASAVLLYV